MRALAELIMSGRVQAIAIAFISGVVPIPIIGQATVALVALRKGPREGLLVLVALLLGPLLKSAISGAWLMYLLAVLLAAVLIFAAAMMLREIGSWSLVLVAVAVVSVIGALAISWNLDLRADMLAQADRLAETDRQLSGIDRVEFEKRIDAFLSHNLAVHLAAVSIAVETIISLIVARWWQAALYKPGGFREEFHKLRIDSRLIMLISVTGLAFMLLPNGSVGLVMILVPLFFGGLAYIHWWVARRRSPMLLWVLYISFITPWPYLVVGFVGLLDGLFNLRQRINENGE